MPLVGDLLGRERVTGAKKTRLGCDSPSERFQNIKHIIKHITILDNNMR